MTMRNNNPALYVHHLHLFGEIIEDCFGWSGFEDPHDSSHLQQQELAGRDFFVWATHARLVSSQKKIVCVPHVNFFVRISN